MRWKKYLFLVVPAIALSVLAFFAGRHIGQQKEYEFASIYHGMAQSRYEIKLQKDAITLLLRGDSEKSFEMAQGLMASWTTAIEMYFDLAPLKEEVGEFCRDELPSALAMLNQLASEKKRVSQILAESLSRLSKRCTSRIEQEKSRQIN